MEVKYFILSLKENAGLPVRSLCTESHVSTRTYYKIMRCETVKNECYYRLFIGLCQAVTDEEFMEQWIALGERLYGRYNED